MQRLIAALLLLATMSCATSQGPGIGDLAEDVNRTRVAADSFVAPGDILLLNLPGGPAEGVSVLVLEDGTATFGALGTVEVAGLLVPQLHEKLVGEYQRVFGAGTVAVAVETRGPRNVSVLGEVAEPGTVELRADGLLTLPEAMARAGGFLKNSAWLSNTLLVRWDPVTQKQRAWKIDARPLHWDDERTILLQPFDLIYVPNTPIDRVGIWVENHIRRLLPVPLLIPTT